ncbi:MAG: biotin--[Eubacterium sp.]|nr:biotin--[acetyl-CoA-carboxylase] ligase [Eubacterium sp.]
MLKNDVLKTLESMRPEPVSGQALADRFGVSRNAVWKVINQLKDEGHKITSVRAGYYLEEESDILSAPGIRFFLSPDAATEGEASKDIPEIVVYDSIDSTNNEAKRRLGAGDNQNLLIVADTQTAGRGRMGHSFYSPKHTGIYMTLSVELDQPLYQPERITLAAAVAVVRAVEPFLTEQLRLKWVNDIFLGDKKVCGILSEGITDLETGLIQHAIVGIGLNVRPLDFPVDLEGIAGSLGLLSPTRNEIVGRITTELLCLYRELGSDRYLEEYLARSMHPEKVRAFLNQ